METAPITTCVHALSSLIGRSLLAIAIALVALGGTSLGKPFTPPPDVFPNHGLTGAWYQPAISGQGILLEVYGEDWGAGLVFVQGSWFTFDAEGSGGQRWYTFGGWQDYWDWLGGASFELYQNVGGNFNAPPVTSPVRVGSVELWFLDCTTASMSYTFSDGSRSGSIELIRLAPNVTCLESGESTKNADFGYSGNWFDPSTAGQGFVFEVNPIAGMAFLAWSTYAAAGESLGAAGQRWYTGQAGYTPGSRVLALTLYETKGGKFGASEPMAHTVPVGTATATFISCNAASFAFSFTSGDNAGASGTINLLRVGWTPADCVQ